MSESFDENDDPRGCDGLHDDGAPEHHLCTRCYPNGREALVDVRIANVEDDLDDCDEECPFCDFGCVSCSPLVRREIGGEA